MDNPWWILEGVAIAALSTLVIFGTAGLVAYIMTRVERACLRALNDEGGEDG